MELADDWAELLRAEAADYAQVALTNIRREFPSGVYHDMTAPGDFPFRPKARTPAFYGSYDWHSCVEMHWLLLRLLRVAEDVIPVKEVRSVLNAHFRPMALAAEVEFVTSKDGLWERPYGWAWALALAHEAALLEDPDGKKWAAALQPLADAVTGCFLDWLPKATYPVRYGVHTNSAFGMARSLDYAHTRARAGVNKVAGSPPAIPGRNTDSQKPNSPSGRILAISSASHSAGDRKSCPEGSQAAGYMVSPPNQS